MSAKDRSVSAGFEGFGDINFVIVIECFFEIIDIDKITKLIPLGFPHLSFFDQIENDASEIFGFLDSPMSKDGLSEQPVPIECKPPNSIEQLGTGNMAESSSPPSDSMPRFNVSCVNRNASKRNSYAFR